MPESDPMNMQHGSDLLAGLDPADLLRQGAAEDTCHGSGVPFVPPDPAELAKSLPQFEILALIGKGGMGAVYRVRQKELDREVALKILPPAIGAEPSFPERFVREAKALAKLNHPGIVTIHEFGQKEGLYFIVMELVEGVNLRQLLSHGRIAPREALAIVPQICDALQYAHDRGIVHRDIKPENILLDRQGRVKVADFGIAKLAASEDVGTGEILTSGGPMTEAGKVLGTPDYMAPEQVERPDEVDHRADIYALGVVFYQMLTGELPERGTAPPSRKVRVDVRLDEVVLRALERDPEMRFQQASVMKTRLDDVADIPRVAPRNRHDMDFRSQATLFGLPLLHVTRGTDPVTGRPRLAKGLIAIGDRAQGVVAFGGLAVGGIAFGGCAVGGFAFGGVAIGLVSFGGLALALLLAIGGLAVGFHAIGGSAFGGYVMDGRSGPEAPGELPADGFIEWWAGGIFAHIPTIGLLFLMPALLITIGVPWWLSRKQERPVRRDAAGAWVVKVLLLVLLGFFGLAGILTVLMLFYWSTSLDNSERQGPVSPVWEEENHGGRR